MGNNIKNEINKIPVPDELHRRAILGIQRARKEMELENRHPSEGQHYKLKLFVGFVAMVSLLISGSILIEMEKNKNLSSLEQASEPAKEMLTTQSDAFSTFSARDSANSAMFNEMLYNSFYDLKKDAKVIVEGDVIESTAVNNNGQVQTFSKVKVWKDYKKVLKKDDVITFLEQGGVATLMNRQPVEVMFEVPVMKLGERVLIFATAEKMDGKEVYLPLGQFQGKFMVFDDVIQRVVPDQLEGRYLSLRTPRDELDRILSD